MCNHNDTLFLNNPPDKVPGPTTNQSTEAIKNITQAYKVIKQYVKNI